jgi:MbtH protein
MNPFEDEARSFHVLCNEEKQYSMWPASFAIPEGWQRVHGPDTRAACLTYIEVSWTDMRPLSLVDTAMK